MRFRFPTEALAAIAVLLATAMPARADPRCARFGQPAYSATRVILTPSAPPVTLRAVLSGAQARIEAPGPGQGQMVTLLTPGLNALFLTTAEPRVAFRMPESRPPDATPGGHRQREQRAPGRITLITELRDARDQWREVERVVCRPDGVLLEARQLTVQDGQPTVTETRHADIRVAAQDPALFRLPEGFRLIEPPPRPGR